MWNFSPSPLILSIDITALTIYMIYLLRNKKYSSIISHLMLDTITCSYCFILTIYTWFKRHQPILSSFQWLDNISWKIQLCCHERTSSIHVNDFIAIALRKNATRGNERTKNQAFLKMNIGNYIFKLWTQAALMFFLRHRVGAQFIYSKSSYLFFAIIIFRSRKIWFRQMFQKSLISAVNEAVNVILLRISF